eukprot:Blabericola_migrator_1__10940@NODE_632_length_7151_cov_76_464286_g463_i0_p3_GENE_NODE_632_length_7151_cov_76_464286_g463_i0NODE_632_length_7151_cov_76_464286_g463_i0_p3_ORF_typecomplete_len330_score26_99CPBP/PF02517_16/4_9e03CPBP/PF02517_16/1_5e08_NODE_632_length_7151_cov_76_464286_g463_i056216610
MTLEVVDWRPLPPEFEGRNAKSSVSLVLGILVGLGPLAVMVLCLDGMLPSGLRAMYLMHFVAMLGIPTILIKFYFQDDIYYRCWWHSQIHYHAQTQLKWLVLLGVVSCMYGVLGGQFVVLRLSTGPDGPVELVHKLKQNLDLNDPWTILCGIWFGFVNPVIEEWFWRVYLWKELGSRCFSWKTHGREAEMIAVPESYSQVRKRLMANGGIAVPPSPAILRGNLDNFLIFSDSVEGTTTSLLENQKVAYDDVRISLTGQLLISALYISYHLMVIRVFTRNWPITLLGGCDLYIYGIIFGLLRSDARFGWWSAVGFHAGLDLALVLSFIWW